MAMDMDYLKQVGDFCVTYGPWAVAIFEGIFIMYLMKSHRKDRNDWEEKRIAERQDTIERYQEYHEEIIKLVDTAAKSKTRMASKIMTLNGQIRTLHRAIEQFLSLITEGIVKINPIKIDDSLEETISDFIDDTCISFSKPKKKEQ